MNQERATGKTEVLTETEMGTLIKNLLDGRGETGATEEEIGTLIAWARGVRIDQVLLDLALERRVTVDVDGGEIVARRRS